MFHQINILKLFLFLKNHVILKTRLKDGKKLSHAQELKYITL